MEQAVNLLSSLPTVVFTALLMFCLSWWIVSVVVGGLSGNDDGHEGHDPHGDGDGPGSPASERDHRIFDLGNVPLSMALLVLSFGAWVTSLALSAVADGVGFDRGASRVVAGIGVSVVAVVAGTALATLFAGAADPVFTTTLAPAKVGAVGCLCRIRIPPDPDGGRLGDAVVVSGPTSNSIIRIERADGAELRRGDIGLVVAYDKQREAFTVSELDEHLRPGIESEAR